MDTTFTLKIRITYRQHKCERAALHLQHDFPPGCKSVKSTGLSIQIHSSRPVRRLIGNLKSREQIGKVLTCPRNTILDCWSLMELNKKKNQLWSTTLLTTERQGCFPWKDWHGTWSGINTSSTWHLETWHGDNSRQTLGEHTSGWGETRA